MYDGKYRTETIMGISTVYFNTKKDREESKDPLRPLRSRKERGKRGPRCGARTDLKMPREIHGSMQRNIFYYCTQLTERYSTRLPLYRKTYSLMHEMNMSHYGRNDTTTAVRFTEEEKAHHGTALSARQ